MSEFRQSPGGREGRLVVVDLDTDSCWRAVGSRDGRFDGRFVTAVRTTGIYCRPSCPAQTPKRTNISFYRHPAAAVAAGFRACKRCRPDAAPGSREWDVRRDLAARALRAISAGVVDEVGVPGLAADLHVSERHLNRVLTAEVGAGPLALARTRRAQTARLLLAATDLPTTRVAFAAGFGSVRQFNDSMLEQFGCAPGQLRRQPLGAASGGRFTVRLAHRPPYDARATLHWLALHQIGGLESVGVGGGPGEQPSYRRVMADGTIVELRPVGAGDGDCSAWTLSLSLDDVARLAPVVAGCRRLLDSDADPAAVIAGLDGDPFLGLLVQRRPGLRIPGATDPWEQAVRTVIGQQVSLAAARTFTARLVEALGAPLAEPVAGLTHRFPTAAVLAESSYDGIGLTSSRVRTLRTLAAAVADGTVDLGPHADRDATTERLLALPGIGPWTVSMVSLRALGDPDAWPGTDLVLRRLVAGRADPEAWRPWRGYAAMHVWVDHLSTIGAMP
jgi:AraC family transcriptional regulator of adaptative response / DNA-3-methyladenine glycosylase II